MARFYIIIYQYIRNLKKVHTNKMYGNSDSKSDRTGHGLFDTSTRHTALYQFRSDAHRLL